MQSLLTAKQVLVHPFIIGEIALGSLRKRDAILEGMRKLPSTIVARDEEVMDLIERQKLFGTGVGLVDAHLIAATLLSKDASLWTRDKRLHAVAERLGIAARLTN